TWDLRQNRVASAAFAERSGLTQVRQITYAVQAQIGCATDGKKISVWDRKTGREIGLFDAPSAGRISCCPEIKAIIHDGVGAIAALNFETGKQIWLLPDPIQYALVEAIPNVPAVLAINKQHFLVIFDARTATEITRLSMPNATHRIGFSPDG